MTALHLNDRAIIRLSAREESEDVAVFLQGLVTNDVAGNLPVYAALLSAQGKTMFDFLVWSDNDDLLIDCEASQCDDLVKRLSLYRLRRPIDIARDDSLAVYWQNTDASPKADAKMSPHLDPRLPQLGYRWISPVETANKEGTAQWRAHRLSLGITEGHAELADILWLETNAVELNGVSFEKGCYIGQENTARMNWRNKINRRLVVVPLDASQEKRCKTTYTELGLAIDHLRTADINLKSAPDWLSKSLANPLVEDVNSSD